MENLAFLLKEIFQEKHLLLWKNSSCWVGKMEHVKSEILQCRDVLCQFSGRLHLCVELHFSFLWFPLIFTGGNPPDYYPCPFPSACFS